MPNWCQNTLMITGVRKEIENFLEKAKNLSNEEKYISLERLFPVPAELKKERKGAETGLETMSDEEYDWRVNNWGVKWDLSDFSEPKWIFDGWRVHFATPWGPPYESMVKIAKLFPKLTFDLRYFEPGMAFEGRLKISGGKIEEEWERDLVDCGEEGAYYKIEL